MGEAATVAGAALAGRYAKAGVDRLVIVPVAAERAGFLEQTTRFAIGRHV